MRILRGEVRSFGAVVPRIAGICLILALPQVAEAQNALKFGTWKLDAARSQLNGSPPITEIRKYEDRGCGVVHSTREGVNARGEEFFSSYAARFDGEDYPRVVLGSDRVSTIAFTPVDDYTEEWVVKVDGRITLTGETTVSGDGQTMTTTVRRRDAQSGALITTVSVYRRQR